jgi:ribonuclease BN (tRNA processing enzyme)
MRVVILGAGTVIPASGHSPAGIYVQVGREHVLLDAGPGTLQRLHAARAPFRELDRIFLTHFHLDHCLDLASILFALRLPDLKRRKPLTVYGPPGLVRLYRRLNTAFHGWLSPRGFKVRFVEVQDAALRLPGYAVRSKRMHHGPTRAVGYRLTARGRSLAYSGDTDVCRCVAELGRKADALILECSVTDERKVAGHLTPSDCGWIAAEAHCRRLVLTHFYPVFAGYDIRKRVRRHFRGPLTLARDFTSFRL